jgi:hypothetical protein
LGLLFRLVANLAMHWLRIVPIVFLLYPVKSVAMFVLHQMVVSHILGETRRKYQILGEESGEIK